MSLMDMQNVVWTKPEEMVDHDKNYEVDYVKSSKKKNKNNKNYGCSSSRLKRSSIVCANSNGWVSHLEY